MITQQTIEPWPPASYWYQGPPFTVIWSQFISSTSEVAYNANDCIPNESPKLTKVVEYHLDGQIKRVEYFE